MSVALPLTGTWSKDPRAGSTIDPFEPTFELPADLAAAVPPEARGITRDAVRLMVSDRGGNRVRHTSFRDVADFLDSGDLLVVNTSATINAALAARWRSGTRMGESLDLHLSTPVPGANPDQWVVELRAPVEGGGSVPILDGQVGDELLLVGGASATLLQPYRGSRDRARPFAAPVRLWIARLNCAPGVLQHASSFGRPIQYRYVRGRWPLDTYQTVFSDEPGSAEMPSAGRPFTPEVLARLRRDGVRVAPLVLHTGVSSLETHEPPYPEWYRVPPATAGAVNSTRERGGRVIAVGTTVVRALETVSLPDGTVQAGDGWTDLVIAPKDAIRTVDGMLTGLHEPSSSHLSMLEALVGRTHLEETYRAALEERYLWHEFGDVHLMFS